ncbi:MAG TPA: TauD/TfdA family dioxygenase [Micromonospora sp.]
MSAPVSQRYADLNVTLTVGSPPVVEPTAPVDPADAVAWLSERAEQLGAVLRDEGVFLVRGLGLDTPERVGQAARVFIGEPIAERESFAKRRSYGDHVYSGSEWSADQPMCMHHEVSYARVVPSTIVFGCLRAPAVGGCTAVADAQQVLKALPERLVSRFETEGWILTRNYGGVVGVPWQDAFGTGDRAGVEEYCRANGIETTWRPDGTLRTRQRRNAVLRHPVTGERCWFNQVAFLNEWTLDPVIREYLLLEFGPDGLPFNSAHGDGEAIGDALVQLINDTYEGLTRRTPWRTGDLMVVDNVRTAHSREVYEGDREIAVVLGDPLRAEECAIAPVPDLVS